MILNMWDTLEAWPHQIHAGAILGQHFHITIAREDSDVALAVWRERQRMFALMMTPHPAAILARALDHEAHNDRLVTHRQPDAAATASPEPPGHPARPDPRSRSAGAAQR